MDGAANRAKAGTPGASAADPWQPDERTRRLADAMSAGVAVLEDGRIAWASDRLVEMAGRGSREALRGLSLAELLESEEGRGLPGSRVLRCGLRRPDGEVRAVICRAAWSDAGAGGSAWVIEDVTHVRALEAELLRTSRRLASGNRELEATREKLRGERADREELLTVVSHELRTPVTVIGGFSRLLLSERVGPLNAEQRRFLEECQKGCQRLDAFIGNLLEASRRWPGGEVLEIAHGRLSEPIRAALDLLRPLWEERELRVDVRIAPGAERARFDRMRVEQVLMNLLGNAIRYAAPSGSIQVDVMRLASGDLVEVSVADDGPGVPPGERERVCEPYVRVGGEGAGGLGLGLAICRRLVEAHGGTIGVDGGARGGARFHFTLPVSEPGVSEPGVGEPEGSPQAGLAPGAGPQEPGA